MQPLVSSTPYRTGRGLAAALVALLAANILTLVLSALTSLAQLVTGAAGRVAADEGELVAVDFVELGVLLLRLPVFVATVVLFCVWLFRAYRNLPALGNPRSTLQHSAGWAVGSFFVPVVNLFVPYRAVRETWAKSGPRVAEGAALSPPEAGGPPRMKLWWGFWVASNFVDNAAFRVYMRAETPDAMVFGTWLDMIGDTLSVVAAAFAIAVVREVDRRQEERSRRVVFAASQPPPPPIFRHGQ